MNVAFLLNRYFNGNTDITIDVFDAQTLNAVYQNVIDALTSHIEIEISVLQSLSYCLYEMMDNVRIHSTTERMPLTSLTKLLLKQKNWIHYGRL